MLWMHPRRMHWLLIVALTSFFTVSASSADPVIENAEFNVRAVSASQFEVQLRIRVGQASRAKGQQISHYLVRVQDEGLSSLTVSGEGDWLNHRFSPGRAVDRLEIELGQRLTQYVIRYRVVTTRNRVPLFVPEIPVRRGVEIRVEPGSGLAITGSTLPALDVDTVDGETVYRAELANIPAFLMMRLEPLSEVSWTDRFLTVGKVTDLALLLLILGSTAYWLRIRRMAVREMQKRKTGAA